MKGIDEKPLNQKQTHSTSPWVLHMLFWWKVWGSASFPLDGSLGCCSQTKADLSVEILNKWDEDSEAFQQSNVTRDETWLYEYDLEDKIQSK